MKTEEVLNLPDVQPVDRKKLPCFQKVLSRYSTESVGMNEINNLEAELEMLLSKVTLRSRALRKEANIFTAGEKLNNSRKKKGKSVKKKKEPATTSSSHLDPHLYPSSELKNLLSQSLPSSRLEPSTYGHPTHPTVCGKVLPDNAQLTDTKNEATSKFWTFVEPYVAEFETEDLKVLDELIAKYDSESTPSISDIPPLGQLWASKWGEGDLLEEKASGAETCKKLRKAGTGSDQENVKDILNRAEQICTTNKLELPENLVERIVGALVDPDLFPDDTKNNNSHCVSRNIKDESSDVTEPKRRRLNDDDSKPGISNHRASNNNTLDVHLSSLDSRLRRGLSEQFQMRINKADEESDEILVEIFRCQEELRMLCAQNKSSLESLRRRVEVELERQKLKRTLTCVEEEVIEITKKSRKIEPQFTAQSLTDGVKILDNRRIKLSEEDTARILSILQKRNQALSDLHGTSVLKC